MQSHEKIEPNGKPQEKIIKYSLSSFLAQDSELLGAKNYLPLLVGLVDLGGSCCSGRHGYCQCGEPSGEREQRRSEDELTIQLER